MHAFPHYYRASATAVAEGDVDVTSDGLPHVRSASPAEFDGPGDRWSPETLLIGAIADCYILTFRAIARASKLEWISLECGATGTLERVDRVTGFTHIDLRAHLVVPPHTDSEMARRVLEKAERGCLISNSLKAGVHLDVCIEVLGAENTQHLGCEPTARGMTPGASSAAASRTNSL
jgi:peroxiredoxin-like protein